MKNGPPATPCPDFDDKGHRGHVGPMSAHEVGSHHRHAASHKPFKGGGGMGHGGKKKFKDKGGAKHTGR